MNPSIRSILHPTDFSPRRYEAYAHALRLALATKSKFYILHALESEVGERLEPPQARLRRLLVQWGVLNQMNSITVNEQKLGLEIENFTFRQGYTPAEEIVHFLNQHACDLVVLATHHGGRASIACSRTRSRKPCSADPEPLRSFLRMEAADSSIRSRAG